MKSLFLFIISCCLATLAQAQQYSVSESELDIKGVPRKGQRILIQLDSKEVERAWENHLREKAGKIVVPISLPKNQVGKGISVLEKARIDTISKTPLRIISKVEATEEGTAVWWTLDLGHAYVSKEGTPQQYAAAEGFLQAFARKVYRQDLQRQVEEANKVLQSAQNEENRVMRQAEDLKKSLERNAQRKLDLEAELARNAVELTQLQAGVENNVKQQEAARQEVENMKKAVEVVKAKADAM
ncbi:MAG: DNA repair ATPase [Adhaeribacter sp.]